MKVCPEEAAQMSVTDKLAAISRQRAEKVLGGKAEPIYADEATALEKQRRADDEKTARLRALRLAREAAEAERNAAEGAKPRKRRG
jgi:hypothetical protein